MKTLTQETLKYLLDYNPETGVFTWKVYRNHLAKAGYNAGSINSDGYIQIKVNCIPYKAHRLAWLYVTGTWPKNEIDHKNLIKHDNIFDNLREADHFQNTRNTGIQKNNTSGFKGVTYEKDRKKYKAHIGYKGKRINLGRYDSAEEAHEAYKLYAVKYFGEFARFA